MNGVIDISEVLLIVLVLVAFVQLCVYWIGYRRLAFYRSKVTTTEKLPVSVIICARNESARLKENLPLILNQDYSSFEVIVINDCSWDETDLLLMEFAKEYPHLKIVTIKEQEKYSTGKKFALTLGIKAASNECLLFTDADCKPSSNQWIYHFQRMFSESKEIVIGYGPYEKEKGLLNKLIRFDTFISAVQYLSSSIGGNTYMGVGRNLAYKKSLFFRSKGFAKHNHLLSGDDDLFVNENATNKNTAIEIDPTSFTYSEPKRSYSKWITQKKRHLSTAKYYRTPHQMALLAKNASVIVYYLLLITLLILRYDWRILISLHAILLLVKFPIIYRTASKLKENDLIWLFPILELIQSFLQPLFFFANLLTKQKTWK